MRKFLVALALVLCASSAYADHGKRYVDPSRGSSWTWRPNNPVVVVLPPVRGCNVVRPTLPAPSYDGGFHGGGYYGGSGGYYSGGGYGSVYKFGSGPAAQKVIIVNPYCQ